MSGEFTGLQARIQEIKPMAMYSLCSAHSLNYSKHSTSNDKESCDLFMLLNNFFSSCIKRWEVLTELLSETKNLLLKALSKTCWPA